MKIFLLVASIPVLLASARSARGPRRRHGLVDLPRRQHGRVDMPRRRLGGGVDVTADIINGTQTNSDRYPYQTLISPDGSTSCGAFLIAPNLILSAAHCFGWTEDDSDARIYVGAHDLTMLDTLPSEQVIAPGGFTQYIHPDYDACSSDNDQMIILLKENITTIDPVKIDIDGSITTSLMEGDPLQVIGWGRTDFDQNGDPIYSDILMGVDVGFIPDTNCSALWHPNPFTDDTMLCAQSPYKDSCQGDSGGPLFRKGATKEDDIVVGIVSFGLECGGPINKDNPPGVYSEIAGSSFISNALKGIFPERCNGSRIAVSFFGDDDSDQDNNRWEIIEFESGNILAESCDPEPVPQNPLLSLCLDDGDYAIRVFDDAGNGIENGGVRVWQENDDGTFALIDTWLFPDGRSLLATFSLVASSEAPSSVPSDAPSSQPSPLPSPTAGDVSPMPSSAPSSSPSATPSTSPSKLPSASPSSEPSDDCSNVPPIYPPAPGPSFVTGIWVPPLSTPGVDCEHKRIKIPNHGTYTCMEIGKGICRDNGGNFGEWRFGIDTVAGPNTPDINENWTYRCPLQCPDESTYPSIIDPATKTYPLIGPYIFATGNGPTRAGEICKVDGVASPADCRYAGTTHVCIGENTEDDPNKFTNERPYMFFYDEKRHEFLYQLVCDGTGDLGKLPQLKMVNNEDLATQTYVNYPVDIAKFKKGATADPTDANELWDIYVDWNGYVDPVTRRVGKLAAFTKFQNNFCTEYVEATSTPCWEKGANCANVQTSDSNDLRADC